jgi:PAS domain S-box-containing protein
MQHILVTLDDNAPAGFEKVESLSLRQTACGVFALWTEDPVAGEAAARHWLAKASVLLVAPSKKGRAGLERLSPALFRFLLPADMNDKAAACVAGVLDIIQTAQDAADSCQSFKIDLARAVEDRRMLTQEFNMARESLLMELAERRVVERALSESEERIRMILDSVSDAIFIHDGETGAVLQINRRMCEMYQCMPEEALHNSAEIFSSNIPPYTPKEAAERLQHTAQTGTPQTFEWNARDKTGRIFWVEVALRRANIGGQNLVIATVRDITTRKSEEETRYRAEAQMRHTQKLESLGVLAGGIAHDFNNLLTAIIGNLDLAMFEMTPTAVGRDFLREAEKASRRAADICRQMLAYAGRSRVTIQQVDLGHLVKEMVYLLEVSVPKKVALRYHLATDLPAVAADATQLWQVIMNLVLNAAEAVGDNVGTVTLITGVMHCGRAYLDECLLGDVREPGGYTFLEVSDTGCGMDAETRKRIFEPFFTTKATGRGLGLAAVLGIIRSHNGAVRLYSEPGHGTSFKVLLPAAAESAMPEAEETMVPNWQGSGTVLVVDDEQTLRTLVQSMLLHMGFKVRLAADGREAVRLFREIESEGEPIACVLLDMTMPHMDGEETFREIRQLRPDVKVLLASGYNEHEAAQRFAEMGAAAFMQKPYRMATLQHHLINLLSVPPASSASDTMRV